MRYRIPDVFLEIINANKDSYYLLSFSNGSMRMIDNARAEMIEYFTDVGDYEYGVRICKEDLKSAGCKGEAYIIVENDQVLLKCRREIKLIRSKEFFTKRLNIQKMLQKPHVTIPFDNRLALIKKAKNTDSIGLHTYDGYFYAYFEEFIDDQKVKAQIEVTQVNTYEEFDSWFAVKYLKDLLDVAEHDVLKLNLGNEYLLIAQGKKYNMIIAPMLKGRVPVIEAVETDEYAVVDDLVYALAKTFTYTCVPLCGNYTWANDTLTLAIAMKYNYNIHACVEAEIISRFAEIGTHIYRLRNAILIVTDEMKVKCEHVFCPREIELPEHRIELVAKRVPLQFFKVNAKSKYTGILCKDNEIYLLEKDTTWHVGVKRAADTDLEFAFAYNSTEFKEVLKFLRYMKVKYVDVYYTRIKDTVLILKTEKATIYLSSIEINAAQFGITEKEFELMSCDAIAQMNSDEIQRYMVSMSKYIYENSVGEAGVKQLRGKYSYAELRDNIICILQKLYGVKSSKFERYRSGNKILPEDMRRYYVNIKDLANYMITIAQNGWNMWNYATEVRPIESIKNMPNVYKFMQYLRAHNLDKMHNVTVVYQEIQTTLFGSITLEEHTHRCRELYIMNSGSIIHIQCYGKPKYKSITIFSPSRIMIEGKIIRIVKHSGNTSTIIEIYF